METPIDVILLPGFDPDGDPEIRRTATGRLWLVFNFMPPSWVAESDMDPCDDFDRQLEAAIGVPVVWEDREFFRIDTPQPDTIDRIKQFLADFRAQHDQGGQGA